MNAIRSEVRELAARIGEVLHYIWDPIGIAGVPQARDEYDMYVSQVISQLMRDAAPDKVADLLNRIEDERMGLTPNRARAEQAATLAFDWFDHLGGASHDA